MFANAAPRINEIYLKRKINKIKQMFAMDPAFTSVSGHASCLSMEVLRNHTIKDSFDQVALFHIFCCDWPVQQLKHVEAETHDLILHFQQHDCRRALNRMTKKMYITA